MEIKLAVILPSRGMSFSQTCEELLNELRGIKHQIFFSIGNPIPDCFNIPLDDALTDKSFTHVLIVEDDMIIPKGILKQMLRERYPVVALDYPFRKDGDSTVMHDPAGTALYTGTGFMLIERWLLDLMPKPIFKIDTAWDMMMTTDNKLVCWSRDVSDIKTYGLHDVHFGITLWSNDLPIRVMKKTAGQRKLRARGPAFSNNGAHDIYKLTIVRKNNTAKSDDEELVKKYVDRLSKITSIEILEEAPDNIYYEGNQAYAKDKHLII